MRTLLVNGRELDYVGLPAHMRGGMRRYMEEGIQPGDFLMAVLCNDLMGAFHHADDVNITRLFEHALWLYNEAPAGSFGSVEKVREWMRVRRALAAALEQP